MVFFAALLLAAARQDPEPVLPQGALRRLLPLQFLHESGLVDAALSRDGSRLATLDADGSLNVWDVADRRRLVRRKLAGRRLLWSPTGKALALELPEGLLLLDPETVENLRMIAGIVAPAFSPDGELVAGVDGRSVRRWRVATGVELPRLMDKETPLGAVAFSPDGRRIAAAYRSESGFVFWEDAEPLPLGSVHPGRLLPSTTAAFSPDGGRLALGGPWGTEIWSLEKAPRRIAELGLSSGTRLAWSDDGRRLIGLQGRRRADLWDMSKAERLREWQSSSPAGESFRLSEDGRTVIRLVGRGLLLESAAGVSREKPWLGAVSFNGEGRPVSSGSDGQVWTWDLERGLAQDGWKLPRPGARYWSESASRALVVEEDGARIWDAARRLELLKVGPSPDLTSVSLSPDGRLLAVGDGRLRMSVWEVDVARPRFQVDQREIAATSTAFSPDGKLLACGERSGGLTFLETGKGRAVLRLAPRGTWSPITHIAFALAGEAVATADAEGTIRVWRLQAGVDPVVRPGPPGRVSALACSPDGRRLAWAGENVLGFIFADVEGAAIVHVGGGWTTSLAFSPDGRRLATGNTQGELFLWTVPSP